MLWKPPGFGKELADLHAAQARVAPDSEVSCTGCGGRKADTLSGKGKPWHAGCLARIGGGGLCGPLHRPLTTVEFLKLLTPEERLRKNPSTVATNHIGPLTDRTYYTDLISEMRDALPSWRKRPQGEQDPYAIPIMNRVVRRRDGRRCDDLLLHESIRRRKLQEAADTKKRRHTEALEFCRAKYGTKINAIAAICRTGPARTRDAIRRRAREFLGLSRISIHIPEVVQEEMERQREISSSRLRPAACELPVAQRWKPHKQARAHHLVKSTLTSREYYHTSASRSGQHHVLVAFGAEPSAIGETLAGPWKRYGRRYYREAGDWQTRLTLPTDWWTQIQAVGTHVVEGKLVLAVDRALPAKNGREAYAVDVLIQRVGAKVSIKRVAIVRAAGGAFRIGKLPRPTRYDLILRRDATVKMPPRRVA